MFVRQGQDYGGSMRRHLKKFSTKRLLCNSALIPTTALAWAIFSAGGAIAQDGQSATVLQTIVVKGKREATAPIDGYVAQTSNSGTKTDTPILQTPQSLSVVSATEIKDRDARTLADVL